jgi:hypothetical protein
LGHGSFDLAIPFMLGAETVFQISGQLPNLQNLPFTARFDASTVVAGQNVYLSSLALAPNKPIPATTITLMPQTVNGTVSGVSSSGNYQVYTVALASYDLFPNLAIQSGQSIVLNDPGTIVVYVDSNTQMLNSAPLVTGSGLRFNGLIINDGGTLRMACAQIDDGVAE